VTRKGMSVEAEYRLDWTDVLALQRHLVPVRRWLLYWVLLLMLAVFLVIPARGQPRQEGATFNPFYLILGACVALIPALVWLLNRYVAWVTWRRVAPIAGKGTWKIGVATDGLSLVTPDAQSFIKWSGIDRIDETPTHAFFFQTKQVAYVLPARAFASAVEFHTFVGLARQYKDGHPAAPAQPAAPPDAITRTSDFTS
jgi:hypothetical protein